MRETKGRDGILWESCAGLGNTRPISVDSEEWTKRCLAEVGPPFETRAKPWLRNSVNAAGPRAGKT